MICRWNDLSVKWIVGELIVGEINASQKNYLKCNHINQPNPIEQTTPQSK
jgi:hypothetical protein